MLLQGYPSKVCIQTKWMDLYGKLFTFVICFLSHYASLFVFTNCCGLFIMLLGSILALLSIYLFAQHDRGISWDLGGIGVKCLKRRSKCGDKPLWLVFVSLTVIILHFQYHLANPFINTNTIGKHNLMWWQTFVVSVCVSSFVATVLLGNTI